MIIAILYIGQEIYPDEADICEKATLIYIHTCM